jgi:hypothetical protein
MQCKVSALECGAGMQPMARAPKQGQGCRIAARSPREAMPRAQVVRGRGTCCRCHYRFKIRARRAGIIRIIGGGFKRVIIYYSSPFGDRVAMFPPARLVGVGRSSHAHLLKATHACPLCTRLPIYISLCSLCSR